MKPKIGFVWSLKQEDGNAELSLPEEIIIRSQTKSGIVATTLTLLKLNQRINESIEEILIISDKVISRTMGKLREEVSKFYIISDAIGQLDFLLSAAIYSSKTPTGI